MMALGPEGARGEGSYSAMGEEYPSSKGSMVSAPPGNMSPLPSIPRI